MTVGLMMIVRNEAHVVRRLVQSLEGKVDYWTVVDTGSTDDTMQLIEEEFRFRGIPGQLIEQPWKGFGPSRNDALEAAEGKTDWLLWLDADETVEGDMPVWPKEDVDAIEAEEHYFNLRYWKPYLVRSGRGWRWEGRAHEALVTEEGRPRIARTDSFCILHHADGGNRGNKFERDLELLHQDWVENPNPRIAFYLGRTYEDGGDREEAAEWYATRLRMGGWQEEVFFSLYRLGCLLDGDTGCGMLWRAWGLRPHRAEPLLALCERYRLTDQWQLAWLAAFTALSTHQQLPSDLFADADAAWKIRYELSIAGWYTDHKDLAHIHLRHLLKQDLPEPYRTSVQQNAAFYGEQT